MSPVVHGIVDDGVEAAVEHGQPVEGKIHVLRVPGLGRPVREGSKIPHK